MGGDSSARSSHLSQSEAGSKPTSGRSRASQRRQQLANFRSVSSYDVFSKQGGRDKSPLEGARVKESHDRGTYQ